MDQHQVMVEVIKEMNLGDKKVQQVWVTVLLKKDLDNFQAD